MASLAMFVVREMIIDQIKVVDEQIALRKVGAQNISSPEVGSEVSVSTNAYSSMNGQGNHRGRKGDNTSIPNSSNFNGKVKKQLVAYDILGNPLSKPYGTPHLKNIYVTPK